MSYADWPLEANGRKIRLITLYPGVRPLKLHGSLEVADLSHCQSFEALSYTWGARTLNKCVDIHGSGSIPITDNLYRALRRLRYRHKKRVLWVDAICINQDDIEERSQQVTFMGDIYASARRVCVWLGGCNSLQSIPLRLIPICAHDWFKTLALGSGTLIELADRMLHAPLRAANALYVKALGELVQQSTPQWHERAWVVQELYFAKDVLWCYGPCSTARLRDWLTSIELDDFMHDTSARLALHHLRSVIYQIKVGLQEHCKRKDSEFAGTSEEYQLRPIRVVMYTSYTEASEQRDQVYSLRSIIGGSYAAILQPDYRKPVVQVFADATYALMMNDAGLEVFHLVSPVTRKRIQGLPSWTVDFSFNGFEPGICYRLVELWMPSVLPEGNFLPVPAPELCVDSQRLKITAILFDQVAQSQPDLDWHSTNDEQHCSRIAGLLYDLVQKYYIQGYPPKMASSDVPWRGDFIRNKKLAHAILNSVTSAIKSLNDDRSGPTRILDWWDRYVRSEAPWMHFASSGSELPYPRSDSMNEENRAFDDYARAIGTEGSFILLEGGFLGRCTGIAENGDVVALAQGCKLPILLRPQEECYTFRGLCFVNGIGDVTLESFWEANGVHGARITLC